MIIRHDSNINVFPNACMRTPIPICAGTERWSAERRNMGAELSKTFDDDTNKHIHDLLQRLAAQVTTGEQADDAQKAAEEIVFGFYRSGNLPSAIVLLDL
jgi:hypothetical protein